MPVHTPKTRSSTSTKKALNRLEKAGRRRESLPAKEPRAPIPAVTHIGKDQGTSSAAEGSIGIAYEQTTVTSVDGIFVFDVMVDKALLP